MKKVNLYVDDLRDCPSEFIVARTVEQALDIIKKGNVHILSLDHDMGQNDKSELRLTGYDLVKYFCEYGLYVDKIYIHTDNNVGRDNMFYSLLASQRRGFIKSEIEIYYYPIVPNKYSHDKNWIDDF